MQGVLFLCSDFCTHKMKVFFSLISLRSGVQCHRAQGTDENFGFSLLKRYISVNYYIKSLTFIAAFYVHCINNHIGLS